MTQFISTYTWTNYWWANSEDDQLMIKAGIAHAILQGSRNMDIIQDSYSLYSADLCVIASSIRVNVLLENFYRLCKADGEGHKVSPKCPHSESAPGLVY